jgi:hypothetical protein
LIIATAPVSLNLRSSSSPAALMSASDVDTPFDFHGESKAGSAKTDGYGFVTTDFVKSRFAGQHTDSNHRLM